MSKNKKRDKNTKNKKPRSFSKFEMLTAASGVIYAASKLIEGAEKIVEILSKYMN